jgi:hypothetical protein
MCPVSAPAIARKALQHFAHAREVGHTRFDRGDMVARHCFRGGAGLTTSLGQIEEFANFLQ